MSVADDRERNLAALAIKERKILAFRDLASLASIPQWRTAKDRCDAVIEKILDTLPEVFGPQRDQLIGELKAWRSFSASPEAAAEMLHKLNIEVDRLRAATK
jgi:hypothetical protein